MDITAVVCDNSISTKRMLKMLSRHGVEVVVCRKTGPFILDRPTGTETLGNLVHPSGHEVTTAQGHHAVMSNLFRNEFSWNSLSSAGWTRQDSLLVRKLFKEQGYPISSVSRQSDLQLRSVGMVNPEYMGTLVAVQETYTRRVNHVLVVANRALYSSNYSYLRKEVSDFVSRDRAPHECLYIMSRNEFDQWILEKVR